MLVSFVVAFGVARLLAGSARQYVFRAQTPIYPLQVSVSALLLVGLLQSTWAFWFARDLVWTFGSFLLMLLTQLSLLGAAALIHPPVDHSSSIRDYYFDVRRAVFGLCAAWIILGGITDFVFLRSGFYPPEIPFDVVVTFRTVALGIFVLMTWSNRPVLHWAGLAMAAVLQFVWILGISNNPNGA
jgi:hypothetical protein